MLYNNCFEFPSGMGRLAWQLVGNLREFRTEPYRGRGFGSKVGALPVVFIPKPRPQQRREYWHVTRDVSFAGASTRQE